MEFDVKQIAKSARLKITKEEEIIFEKNILDIIKMIERLNQVNFSDIDIEGSLEDILLKDLPDMKYRDDVQTKSMTNKELRESAPKALAGCIIVPKIVE